MLFLHDVNRCVVDLTSCDRVFLKTKHSVVIRYFTIMEPWVLSKAVRNSEDVRSAEYKATKERLDTVLYLAIDASRMSGT